MSLRTILYSLLVSAMLCGTAAADFFDGLAAYDSGDYQAAYLAWLPLAKSGDTDAQAAIADLYLSEHLTQPAGANERRRVQRTGIYWYTLAARCGNAVAQLNLGDLNALGIGTGQDPVQAYLWLGLAARQGRDWAAARQREVASEMTADRIAEAETLIADWRPAPECRL